MRGFFLFVFDALFFAGVIAAARFVRAGAMRAAVQAPYARRSNRPGGEMVDAGDLKSPGRKAVRVRVPPRAPQAK
jgi:hypothetical protein